MLDALFFGFHVAVEHGGVGMQAGFVGLARDFEPLAAGNFVVADDFAHARIENFGTAAGKRIDSRFFQRDEDFADGTLRDSREIADLDHGECLQVHGGAALLEAAHEVEKIFEGQIGMQAADHVKFGGAGFDALLGALPDFLEREGVSAGSVGIAAEGAEFAVGDANVGGIDVAIDVVIADVAVALFADKIREPADGEQIARTVERDAIGVREALACHHFFGDVGEMFIGDLEWCGH